MFFKVEWVTLLFVNYRTGCFGFLLYLRGLYLREMKNKLKRYLRTGISGIGIAFLLWNCENESAGTLEEQSGTIATVSIDEAVNFFMIETISKPTKTDKKVCFIPDLSHISQEKIINSEALLTVIPATTKHENHYSRILLLKINNEIQSLIFSMYASGTASPYFSGEIMITNLQREFLNGYRIENGKFVSQFRRKEEYKNTAAKTGNVVCPEHGECTGETDCILCLQELEEVEVTGEASGSGNGIEIYPGLNDFPGIEENGNGGPDTGMSWDYGPGEDVAPKNDEENVEDQIVIDTTFVNNPCLIAIYEQMGGAATFKDHLKDFDGDFSIADLNFTVGVHPDFPSASAVTNPPDNYMIEIMFNPNQLDRPILDVARTMIHELIHVEIYRKLLSLSQQGSIPWSEDFIHSIRNNYPGLYDYYMRYYYDIPEGVPPGDPQHQLMAQHYRDVIEQALREFDDSQTDEIYAALAWTGLKNTVAWNNLSPEEQNTINQIRAIFLATHPDCQE